MKLLSYLVILILLVGCSTSPIKTPFPKAPVEIMAAPAPLKTFHSTPVGDVNNSSPSGISLSEVGKVVTDNYQTCNLYRAQIRSLQDWINEQYQVNH
jgi:hypothetical protein